MGTELAPFTVPALPVVSDDQLKVLDDVAQASDFLGRIQLIARNSKYVDAGFPAGNYGIPGTGEEITDLGDEIDIVPLAVRAKALDVSDKDAIISVYDTSNAEFQRIKNAPKNTGCMWGPSFLVVERSTGKMYEMFFGSPSGRISAAKLRPFLPVEGSPSQPVTLSSELKTGKFRYYVPVVSKCSEPFDSSAMQVSSEQIVEEVGKFLNPEKEVEKVPEGEVNTRAR